MQGGETHSSEGKQVGCPICHPFVKAALGFGEMEGERHIIRSEEAKAQKNLACTWNFIYIIMIY